VITPKRSPTHTSIPPTAFRSEFDIKRFEDVAPELGVDTLNLCGGAIVDDFDGDGKLDIVTSTYDPRGPLRYFRRQADGQFSDDSVASGLAAQLGGLNCIGADAAEVRDAVVRFSTAFGWEAHLMVTYESLLLTLVAGEDFRTKIGYRIPAMNVNMAAVAAVNRLVDEVENGDRELAGARAELKDIESRPPVYGEWVVVFALGLTAASLSRLFGGDWSTFGIVWLAGAAGTWLRKELGRRGANLFLIPFVAALASGVIGGIAVRLGLSGTPALCLIAPGMIIVPGVPLVNGVREMIKNQMTLGIAHLALGGLITLAIAFGLFVATFLTGANILVQSSLRLLSVPEDAVFSALAALGYLFLFNVPFHLAWACVVCGVASHTTRTLCMHLGIDIVSGTLIGALMVGVFAHLFARYFRAPAVAFAFPGVVAMVPGAFGFRAVIGYLQIVETGAAAPTALVTETLALSVTCLLVVAAIAIGIAVPLIFKEGNRK
jgi:uncharacterized membrane protein YjjP (DUF1212 family)